MENEDKMKRAQTINPGPCLFGTELLKIVGLGGWVLTTGKLSSGQPGRPLNESNLRKTARSKETDELVCVYV